MTTREDAVTNDEIAEILERAADALFVYGRAISVGVDNTGAMCVEAAICHAQGIAIDGGDEWVDHLGSVPSMALARYLVATGAWFRHGITTVFRWCDTTRDDGLVIDTLRHCAKDLRAEVAP